jgi:Flp pilus assembly protein TadG
VRTLKCLDAGADDPKSGALSRCFRRLIHDADGVAAIELAIGMLPLVTLVVGGITYGGVLAALLDINHAAGEGARAAIAGVTTCERQTLAETKARESLIFASNSSAASITVNVTQSAVQVVISLPYGANALTPVLFPVPTTLTATMIANTDGPEFPAAHC